ncbi:SoxR reducing system RseC family protein [Spirochaetia bacterium 38H-sp]|uniref:SoxR reducing system RseC family protein n=1 Tax=Rarispira pelagica TaxID=3141764 RepID=A0ABU9UD76_9SPIR
MKSNKLSHVAKVVSIEGDKIRISMYRSGMCAHCAAKGACSVMDSNEQEMLVKNPGNLRVGDMVKLVISSSTGWKAMIVAFVVPFLLMFAGILIASSLGASEGVSAVAGLGSLALYYAILALFKKRIDRTFSVKIEKISQ